MKWIAIFWMFALLPFAHSFTLSRKNIVLSTAPSLRPLIVTNFTPESSKYHTEVIKLYSTRRTYGRSLRRSQPPPPNLSRHLTLTNLIIALNVFCFFLSEIYPSITRRFMKIDHLIARGQIYRLLTSLFLHGSAYHLFANTFSLSQIGPQIERIFGPMAYVTIYLSSGALANAGAYLTHSSPYALGASGCVFGLLGAYAVFAYRESQRRGARGSAGLVLENLKRTIFINLLYGFSSPHVDNAAHIGGLVAGGLLGWGWGVWREGGVTDDRRRGGYR